MNSEELNLLSLIIGILNYQENVGQNQLQEVIDNQTDYINEHLKIQDEKIDYLISLLQEILNILQNSRGE